MEQIKFSAPDELAVWMRERAQTKDLSLSAYVALVMDNVRRQWVAQQADPELKVRAIETAVAGAKANPRSVEHGEGA